MSAKKVTSLPQREIENTFPKLLIRNYNQWGDRVVALRKKERGIWNEYTWGDCYIKVREIFRGLLAEGMAAGERVVILGDSTPEWFWSELAIQSGRGTVIAINPATSPEKIKYIIDNSNPKLVMVQDQEQLDKLYDIYTEFPFQKLIYWREKGLRHYESPELMSLRELINEGLLERARVTESEHPAHFEQTLALGNGSDPAIIFYVQNSDGETEEAIVSHEFLISSAESILNANLVGTDDEYVSLMNPSWFFEQILGFGAGLLAGQRLNFAEGVETSQKDFREISPNMLAYPSHLWNRLANTIMNNLAASSRLKRVLFKKLLPIGYELANCDLNEEQVSPPKKLLYFIADITCFRPLRDKHGLDHVKYAYSAGGAPLSREDILFFRAIGVKLEAIYSSINKGIVTTPPEETTLDRQLM
ncbi:MAG: AMP-binding protein [Dehalococcoidia bacterium]